MNRQPYGVPPKWWEPRLSPRWVKLLRPVRRRELQKRQKFIEISVAGAENVSACLARGDGVLIAANHSFHYDSYVMYEAAEAVGSPFHIITAWQVFATSRPVDRWMMQRHGCFSIDREGVDRKAFRQAVSILREGRHPLVIFPEGEIYHTAQRVQEFQEGAAAIALAAARAGDRQVVCIPAALQRRHLDDPTPSLRRVLDRLEQRLTWSPRTSTPLPKRVYQVAAGLLALKEIEHFGAASQGPLGARAESLAASVLDRLAERYGAKRDGTLREREHRLRQAIVRRLPQHAASREASEAVRGDLEALYLVEQLLSYPRGYAFPGGANDEAPPLERMVEMVDKLEEDVFDQAYPTVHGRRAACVEFGLPITVDPARGRDAARSLTQLLQTSVQSLLDVGASAASWSPPATEHLPPRHS